MHRPARRERAGRRPGTMAAHRPQALPRGSTYDVLQHILNCDDRLRADPRALARRMADLLDLDVDRVLLRLFARCVQESPDSAHLAETARRIATVAEPSGRLVAKAHFANDRHGHC